MTMQLIDPFMRAKVGTVERAFQLARSGKFDDIDPLLERLVAEGYADAQWHLCGYSSLRKQIRSMCRGDSDPENDGAKAGSAAPAPRETAQ